MDEKGWYGNDLANNIGAMVNEYENDRESYWESKDPDYKIEYDKAERFAQFVLKGTENLVSTQKIDEDLANLQYEINKENLFWRRLVEELRKIKPGENFSREQILLLEKEWPEDPQSESSPLRLVWERFCIDIGYEAEKKIDEGADRIFKLYRLMLSSPPSRPTIDYLLRLSRCYIWGFDPECVILCRSILDTAFRINKICEENQFDYDLKNRIDVAIKKGFINGKIGRLAHTVRIRGNKAIHNQPDATKDVWGTICNTISVLEVLFSK